METIPAHEVPGTVVATWLGVTELAPGHDVYALIDFDRDGAAAEYVTVRASALIAVQGREKLAWRRESVDTLIDLILEHEGDYA